MIKSFKYEFIFFALFVLSRLPSLGHDTFNTDVWKWKARSYDFGGGVFTLNFEKTLQKYHPGVTLMWLGTAGIKIYNFYYSAVYHSDPVDNDIQTVFGLHFVQKLLIVLAIGVTLTMVFYVLRKMFGTKYAFIAGGLLALEPFYIALTREMHLEGLMSTFMLASAVWLYYYLQTKKRKHFIFSGIFAGLAVLTKTSSIFVIPFTGLILFVSDFLTAKNFVTSLKSSLSKFFKWLIAPVVTFVALWPIMWVNPWEAITDMYRGIFVIGVETDHQQFYFGRLVDDPGFTFYFVVLALKVSVYLIAGLIGYLLVVKKHQERSQKNFVYFLLIFSVLYLIELIIPSKKLDRYILPSVMTLSLISSFFFVWLIDKINLRKLTALKYLILFLPAVMTTALVHPDYFSYYNPMFGGLKTGIYVLEPKWMIGTSEIIDYFKNLQKEKNYQLAQNDQSFEELISSGQVKNVLTVGFQEKYYTQIWPFFREMDAWAVIQSLQPFAVKTEYFVYPVWDDSGKIETRFKVQFVDSIKIRGVPVYNVYRRI
jgi:4-amino-4-deoxy-L-arabinose transferase-like glycosyltransferase